MSSFLVALAFAGYAQAQTNPHSAPRSNLSAPIVIFVAGDAMLGRGVTERLRTGRTPLTWMAPVSTKADIAFCNLECVLVDGSGQKTWKPHLFASPDSAKYLKDAGIDLVSVANNHSMDDGETGITSTLAALNRVGIDGVGAARSNGPWPVWERTIHGKRIAWLAATAYGPWDAGGMRIRNIVGTGLVDQVRSLAQAGDIVFVSLHWGVELSRGVTVGQVQLAHDLIDAGAEAVIGHHPHVAQRVESYKGRPIFYSLGNFVFDRLPGRVEDGIVGRIVVMGDGEVGYRVLRVAEGAVDKTLRLSDMQGSVERPEDPSSQSSPTGWGEEVGKDPSSQSSPTGWGEEVGKDPLTQPSPAIGMGERSKKDVSEPAPVPSGEMLVRMVSGRFLEGVPGAQVVVWSNKADGIGMLRVFVRRPGGWRCVAEGRYPKITDLQVGRVVGNGCDQIVVGLFQRAKLDIRNGNRLYVYGVNLERGLVPLWRGSGLSRPFSQFWLLPYGMGCFIVALEKDRLPEDNSFYWISVYRWNGFGVRRVWDTPVSGDVQSLHTGQDGYGPFIAFIQSKANSSRKLIIRSTGAPSNGEAGFAARIDTGKF